MLFFRVGIPPEYACPRAYRCQRIAKIMAKDRDKLLPQFRRFSFVRQTYLCSFAGSQ